MSAFSDGLLFDFLGEDFVRDFLTEKLGLTSLFAITYQTEDIELREITLASLERKEFESPAFETIRTSGTDERIIPATERVKVDRAQPRYGRLVWVDVFLDVLVAT